MQKVELSGFVSNQVDLKNLTILQIILSAQTPELVQFVIKQSMPNICGQFISCKGIEAESSRSRLIEREFLVEPSDLVVHSKIEHQPFELNSLKFKGNLKTELTYRFHSLKLLKNQINFKLSSRLLNLMRNHMVDTGYTEIQTPKIMACGAESGADVFSLDYFGKRVYLAQSPQLYKQQAVVSGLSKVFETNYVYRAEQSDTNRHLTEAYCIDCEVLTINLSKSEGLDYIVDEAKKLVELTFEYVHHCKPNTVTVEYETAYKVLTQILPTVLSGVNCDFNTEAITALSKYYNSDFLVITYFPVNLRPFYIKNAENGLTYSFDLFNKTMELASGGQRENKLSQLENNLRVREISQQSLRSTYLCAFDSQIAAHGGFSIGYARLLAGLLNLNNIREVVMFPRDPNLILP